MPPETRRAMRSDSLVVQDYEKLNGEDVGYMVADEFRKTKLDQKTKNRAKDLTACLKSEGDTVGLLHFVTSRLSVLEDLLNSLKSSGSVLQTNTTQSFSRIVVNIGFEDSVLLLTQLVSTVERYIPRTKHNEGTSQTLRNTHMLLAEKLVAVLSASWLICRLLALHDKDVDVKRLVRSSVPKLVRLLKPSTISVGKQLLRLIISWCTAYKLSFFGDRLSKDLTKELPKILHKGDFEQQWLIGKLLQSIWNNDRNSILEFLRSSNMASQAHEFCTLMTRGSSTSEASKCLPYEIAHIINSSLGIHRRVFSFPIQPPASFCQTADLDESSLVSSPHEPPSEERDPWSLHFNMGAETLSFEINSQPHSAQFVHVPFSAVANVSAIVNANLATAVTFLLISEADDYIDFDLSHSTCGNLRIDLLNFTLKIDDSAQMALLETALDASFNSLDVERDIKLPQVEQISVKLEEMKEKISVPVTWTRELEEPTFRDLLTGFDLLVDPSPNNGIPEKENVSKKSAENGLKRSGKGDAAMDGIKPIPAQQPLHLTVVTPRDNIPTGTPLYVLNPSAPQIEIAASMGELNFVISALPADYTLASLSPAGVITKSSCTSGSSSDVVHVGRSQPRGRGIGNKIVPADITTIN